MYSDTPFRASQQWAVKHSANERITAIGTVLLLLLASMPILAQQRESSGGFDKALSQEIKPIATITPKMHTGLGWFTAELGDLDGDGYDDYAVTSSLDTTFIFYGGDPLPELPRYALPGGSGGVAAGDFNGDGLVDIATTLKTRPTIPDPDLEYRGRIRVYYNTGSVPPFHAEPDQILRGPEGGYTTHGSTALWGFWGAQPWWQGIDACDVNGDAIADLLAYAAKIDTTHIPPPAYYFYQIFLGGDSLPAQPSAEIMPPALGDGRSHSSSDRHYIGDLNGDGMSDIMILSTYSENYPEGGKANWNIYLGNSNARYLDPDAVVADVGSDLQHWLRPGSMCGMADLNHDGCDELISGRSYKYGNVVFFTGRRDITEIVPDDSLSNPDPSQFSYAQFVCPVGDMNGDGTRDVLVAWGTPLFPTGSVYHLYPNGYWDVGKYSRGSFGIIPEVEDLQAGAYPVGDVNGDGFDDVIVVGQPSNNPGVRDIKFKILGGNSKLVEVEHDVPVPSELSIRVYPNPVYPGNGEAHTIIGAEAGRAASLALYDVLGRVVWQKGCLLGSNENDIPIPVNNLSPGVYRVLVTTGREHASSAVIIQH